MSDFEIEDGVLNTYTGPGGKVVIPDGGTEIGSWAFCEVCETLKSVTISNTVENIGESAFRGCQKLTSVTIPGNVKCISYKAFHDCPNLKSVILSEGVTKINDEAFEDCPKLKKLVIPRSVARIGDWAFHSSSALGKVIIENPDAEIAINAFAHTVKVQFADGTDFQKIEKGCTIVGGKLVRYVGKSRRLPIPPDVKTISDGAFSDCELSEIIIPDSVEKVEERAFSYNSVIEEITLENRNIEIEPHAFYRSRARVIFADGTVYREVKDGCAVIGDTLESYVGNDTDITIPDGITSIGDRAFNDFAADYCDFKKLKIWRITIPDSVTRIGEAAFCGCCYLKSITIPDSVTEIGNSAFYGCERLEKITFPPNLTRIERLLFYGCKKLTEVVIPDSIVKIDETAFDGCKKLADFPPQGFHLEEDEDGDKSYVRRAK